MGDPSDAELVQRVVRHDDRRAFAHLVARHQSELRRSLRRFVRDDAAWADDLAQETFLIAYRRLVTFRGHSTLRTWLYRIGYRLFLTQLRMRPPPADAIDAVSEIATNGDDPGSMAHGFMLDYARALTTLTPEQARAVHLSMERGFTHAEIALIMDVPLGTAKSHVLRGRARLQTLLGDWASRLG